MSSRHGYEKDRAGGIERNDIGEKKNRTCRIEACIRNIINTDRSEFYSTAIFSYKYAKRNKTCDETVLFHTLIVRSDIIRGLNIFRRPFRGQRI